METPLKIAICEDKNRDTALLMDYIKQSGTHSVCQSFSSSEDFLNSFTPGHYDVIFMDIYMEGMHGIDTAAKIREVDENLTLAFTTTSADYTLESYRLDALKYLEKPVKLKKVQKTLELASIRRKSTEYISLLVNGKNKKIIMDSIIYFENQNHTVIVNTVTEVLHPNHKVTISHIESMLPNPPFLPG